MPYDKSKVDGGVLKAIHEHVAVACFCFLNVHRVFPWLKVWEAIHFKDY